MTWTTLLVPIASVLSALVAAVVISIGWYISHRLTAERDHRNRQREERLKYLTQAYVAMAMCAGRPITKERAEQFEEAVAKIQLFGAPAEIQRVHEFLKEFSKAQNARGDRRASMDPVLFSLRNALREELKLPPLSSNIAWFRPRAMVEMVEAKEEHDSFKLRAKKAGFTTASDVRDTPPLGWIELMAEADATNSEPKS